MQQIEVQIDLDGITIDRAPVDFEHLLTVARKGRCTREEIFKLAAVSHMMSKYIKKTVMHSHNDNLENGEIKLGEY